MVSVKELLLTGAAVQDVDDRLEYGSSRPARVIQSVRGHYEVRELPYGKVYAWRPGCVVLECGCGERLTCGDSATRCSCGVDHEDAIQRLGNPRPGDDPPPWRADQLKWLEEKAALPPEHHHWLEIREIE